MNTVSCQPQYQNPPNTYKYCLFDMRMLPHLCFHAPTVSAIQNMPRIAEINARRCQSGGSGRWKRARFRARGDAFSPGG